MKLSLILTGRNDNYGGYFNERASLTTKYNISQLKKNNIDYEVIFVEWNPDPEKPLFSEIFSQLDDKIQCYVVGSEIHNAIAGKKTAYDYPYMTFYEFFAKNAALKRATGDLILLSNADVFYCKDTFNFLKEYGDSHAEEDNLFYRSERYDLKLDNLEGLGDEFFLDATFRINYVGGKPYADAAGDFTLASKNLLMKVNGYDENQKFVKIHKDTRILYSAYVAQIADFKKLGKVFHIDHAQSAIGADGTLSNYRSANGPYVWKYFIKLPYKNRDFWGLDSKYFEDVKLSKNIFEIKPRPEVNIGELYNYSDEEYKGDMTQDMSKAYQLLSGKPTNQVYFNANGDVFAKESVSARKPKERK